MLRFIYGNDLDTYPLLRDTMFKDRADQFKTRLNWDVTVDSHGFERDEYDDLNPLYVIVEDEHGCHAGSMRLLPTTQNCMVNDHFLDLMKGVAVKSPLIWECTRFCLSRHAARNVASLLMLAGGEAMVGFGIEQCIGVFDQRMIRIYRMIGASPEILGEQGAGKDYVAVGLWSFSNEARLKVSKNAGVSPQDSKIWFDKVFGAEQRVAQV